MDHVDCIILLSGGLDSCVCLKQTADAAGRCLALTFDYGQRAVAREIEAAAAMAARLNVAHRIIHLDWLRDITTTSLVNKSAPVPEVSLPMLESDDGTLDTTAAQVWVPNRNGVFVNIAAAVADATGAARIVAGFNAEEAATFSDNSPEYIDAVNMALRLSCRRVPELSSPTATLAKHEIVQVGRAIGAPLDLAWPCYLAGERLCGRCESCSRFIRALKRSDNWEWYATHWPDRFSTDAD